MKRLKLPAKIIGKHTAKERKILADIDKAVEQVKLHKAGKIKLKTIQELLDEL